MTALLEQHQTWAGARARLGIQDAQPRDIELPLRARAERLQRKGLLLHEIAVELGVSKEEIEAVLYYGPCMVAPKLPPSVQRVMRWGVFSNKWRTILQAVCHAHGLPTDVVLGRSRKQPIVAARREAVRQIYARTHMSTLMIASCFGRDHTSILHFLGRIRARAAK
jgi:hypothetical protein